MNTNRNGGGTETAWKAAMFGGINASSHSGYKRRLEIHGGWWMVRENVRHRLVDTVRLRGSAVEKGCVEVWTAPDNEAEPKPAFPTVFVFCCFVFLV